MYIDWYTSSSTSRPMVDHTHTPPFLYIFLPFPVYRSTRETTCMDYRVFLGISWRCIPSGSPEYPSVRRSPRSPASSSSPSLRARTRCVTSHKLKLNYMSTIHTSRTCNCIPSDYKMLFIVVLHYMVECFTIQELFRERQKRQ